MYKPRIVLTKVLSRYLSKEEFHEFIRDLSCFEKVPDSLFIEIMKKHFNIERWQHAPMIKQDVWLYNYFQFEHKKTLRLGGLMKKYTDNVFIYDDAEFFKSVEFLNRMLPPVKKGVKFIPNENPSAGSADHLMSVLKQPGSISK